MQERPGMTALHEVTFPRHGWTYARAVPLNGNVSFTIPGACASWSADEARRVAALIVQAADDLEKPKTTKEKTRGPK